MVPTGCILILKALNKHGYILPHIYSTERPEAAWEGSPKSERSPMTPSNSETSPQITATNAFHQTPCLQDCFLIWWASQRTAGP